MDPCHVQTIGGRSAARARVARATKPVVFAGFVGRRPASALLRAGELARRFAVPLEIVLVIPSHDWLGDDDRVGHGKRSVDELVETVAWCDATLATTFPTVSHVRSGSFVSEILAHVRAHGASMIVLAPYEGRSAACVSSLVTGSQVPVLIAWPVMPSSVIVAATDLHDKQYPVLERAADLVEALDTRLVAIHNVEDRPEPARTTVEQQRTELAAALSAFDAVVDITISVLERPADAILKEARSREADLVVVGTRSRSWLDESSRPSTSSEVVCRAQRSVLVTPMVELAPASSRG